MGETAELIAGELPNLTPRMGDRRDNVLGPRAELIAFSEEIDDVSYGNRTRGERASHRAFGLLAVRVIARSAAMLTLDESRVGDGQSAPSELVPAGPHLKGGQTRRANPSVEVLDGLSQLCGRHATTLGSSPADFVMNLLHSPFSNRVLVGVLGSADVERNAMPAQRGIVDQGFKTRGQIYTDGGRGDSSGRADAGKQHL
jgi:hypothetical protein